MMILPFEAHPLVRLSATTTLTVLTSAKERFKELTLITLKATTITRMTSIKTIIRVFKAFIPIWGRSEVLTIFPVSAEAIISRTFLGIFQNGIGLTDFFELIFSTNLFIHIWMVFAGKLAVGSFNFSFGSRACHPQCFVVIPKFHQINFTGVLAHHPDLPGYKLIIT